MTAKDQCILMFFFFVSAHLRRAYLHATPSPGVRFWRLYCAGVVWEFKTTYRLKLFITANCARISEEKFFGVAVVVKIDNFIGEVFLYINICTISDFEPYRSFEKEVYRVGDNALIRSQR